MSGKITEVDFTEKGNGPTVVLFHSSSEWRVVLPVDTTVISARDTVRSIAEIVDLMEAACPDWRFDRLGEGGHMAPLTRPETMNPLIRSALV